MSDEALAAVKLRVETKEIEERRSRYAMDTIALAVRAMPLAARERRVAMAKRRLASALRVGALANVTSPSKNRTAERLKKYTRVARVLGDASVTPSRSRTLPSSPASRACPAP